MSKWLNVFLVSVAVLCGGLASIFLLLAAGGALVQQIHAPLTDRSLARSVANEAGSAFLDSDLNECRRANDGVWRCDVVDGGGSGSWIFNVKRRGNTSCWDARLTHDGGETSSPPENVKGCVNHF